MKTNKLLIRRSEILRKESLKPRSVFPNSRARAWLILQTVGLFLFLTLSGNGQQINASIPEKKSLTVTSKEEPPRFVAEIRTLDGATYKSVRILKAEPDGLLVEHSSEGRGIGLARLKFENLFAEVQQRYGYDVQKAAAYRTQQAETRRQLVGAMQAQRARYEQEWAAARAREEDSWKARLEMEKQETQRRQAEAARAQAEAEWAQARAAEAQAQAAQVWIANSSYQRDQSDKLDQIQKQSAKLNQMQEDVEKIRRKQEWGW